MRPKLALKTLFRSPVRMILTFILLVAVTFTLFSQVLEHAVTVREVNRAAEQYDGVCAVDMQGGKANPSTPWYATTDTRLGIVPQFAESYPKIESEAIDKISALPYITFLDTRYMTAGVSDEYMRLDDGKYFYNYTAQCLIEGTVMNTNEVGEGCFKVGFKDVKIITDVSPEPITSNTLLHLDMFIGGGVGYNGLRTMVQFPQKYAYEGGEEDLIANFEIGQRMVFVARYEPLLGYGENKQTLELMAIGDYIVETWNNWLWIIDEDAPENYIETEEYADLKLLANIINLNHKTFDVVYTDNMDSIMRFSNGSMAIVDGRGIVPEDSLENHNVCVVSREFAKAYELQVGDTITMNLGDKLFEQYKGLGAVPITPARVADSYTEVTLEIVGIYSDLDANVDQMTEAEWSYSVNTIFVPKALLNVPEEELENHTFTSGEVSFVVENAWDIPAFLEETLPKIEEKGYTVIFNDEGWLDMADGFAASKELAVIKIAVLSAAVLVATWFTAMLYIMGRKKDYAIMRVLGTSVKKSNTSLLLPFMTVTFAAVIVGAASAWINTSKTIGSSNALQVLAEFAIDTSIPVGVVVLCVLSELVLAFVIALMMLLNLGKKPPLVLIQGDGAKRKKVKQIVAEPQEPIILGDLEITPSYELPKHPKYERRFVWRYIFRHIKRTISKAILTILLCVLLLNVVGQLDIMRMSYTALVEETVIKSNFVGGLLLENIEPLKNSGYAKDVYYSASNYMDLNNTGCELVVTNDPVKFTDGAITIEYAEGYGDEVFDSLNFAVVIGKDFADMLGVKAGDTVTVSPYQYFAMLCNSYIEKFRRNNKGSIKSNGEILALYEEDINFAFSMEACELTVAGTFVVNDSQAAGTYFNYVFTPGTVRSSSDKFGTITPLGVVEAVAADNYRLTEYREFAEELAGGTVSEGVMFVMDTSKIENLLNTLRLVEMLYPIAVVVTLVIGAFLCGLIIVQTSKDIAIMRVLGTSKAKTRTILVLEQMILCVIGIIISGIVLYIRGALAQMLWVFGAYAIVILLASIVASVAASRKNVLELLQTKE